MRVIAYDKFRPGVTMEQINPYLPEEVANVWRLWKAGIVRENYALEWMFIALQIPLPIETLFREGVDLNPPFDRTMKISGEAK